MDKSRPSDARSREPKRASVEEILRTAYAQFARDQHTRRAVHLHLPGRQKTRRKQ